MSTARIPLLDVSVWRHGSTEERRRLVSRLDDALRGSGFLLMEGHGISPELRGEIRKEAMGFFSLPDVCKRRYRASVGGRGWLPLGSEANAFYGEVADPERADLKESLTIGRSFRTGDPAVDADWFAENVWPDQCPGLEPLCERYTLEVRRVYLELLEMCALALGLPGDWFIDRSRSSPHTFNINHYPAWTHTGPPLEGQFRVGAHTDWGVLTVLDRQPGYGGLQVQTDTGEWALAPYEPNALVVNVGDLLARWTGDRWKSTRHRVLPPRVEAPDEDLVSLIVFLGTDVDTVVEPVTGMAVYPPVVAGEYNRERRTAATVS